MATAQSCLLRQGPLCRFLQILFSAMGHSAVTASNWISVGSYVYPLAIYLHASGRVSMCMWPYIPVHVDMYPHTSDHVSTLRNFVTYVTCERGHLSTCTWLCVHVHMAVYPHVCGHVSTCTWPFIHVVMNPGEHGHVFTCRI
jgi:hypothetical protein